MFNNFFENMISEVPVYLIRIGYMLCALSCLLYFFKAEHFVKHDDVKGYRTLMFITFLIIILMLVLKLSDLPQNILNNIRIMALKQGWYENRYNTQIFFIAGICLSAVLIAVFIESTTISELIKYNWLFFYGIFFLITISLIKYISIHFIDQIMNITILGLRCDHLLELGVISLMTGICVFDFFYKANKINNTIPVSGIRYI